MSKPAVQRRIRVHAPPPGVEEYDVLVGSGLLDELPRHVAAAVTAADRFAIITPEPVGELFGERVLAAFGVAGLNAALLTFPDGEVHKTRQAWAALTDRMLELGFGRRSCVIAMGGGVAGDVGGFVAATYMRGVPVVQVPTTLLAMIDAAVGGKTGVDTPAGKNLVGAFHPPRLVVMDPLSLESLPHDGIRAGLAEAVKHGALFDAAYLDWIAANGAALVDGRPDLLEHLIARSVQLKAAVVAADPFDQAGRAVLNFGHTVGHALEHATGYSLPHGFAVSIGMVVEAVAGELMGVTEPGTAARIRLVLAGLGLPTAPPLESASRWDELAATMRRDKKAKAGVVHCALPAAPGAVLPTAGGDWTHAVPENLLRDAVQHASPGSELV
jgi:3-dehydroquinate synthase